ncbi:hypothetical protein CLV99_2641 [Sphingobacterium yanglingense]|uniref:Uncharacterized protein n=1 Tax=Sphingobacterium yanglingense TaxID=1437280 RepID=A0A4R6WHG8_9SPHI|nr:hypothetical protein CLV99_2641 [Sphingobacterium yanglingense]
MLFSPSKYSRLPNGANHIPNNTTVELSVVITFGVG